jgi:membrane protease YdiL (CAAX protease family)
VSTQTTTFGRIFGRADGRDRIAVPFWNGLLSAIGAVLISLAVGLLVAIPAMVTIILATGNMPSLNPGHPLLLSAEAASYVGAGWFAWRRLRATGREVFHRLLGADVRAILIGVAVTVLVRIATAFQLTATHQTNHVQSGFEHFTVVGKLPTVTIISVALTVLCAVCLAPLVEEMIFRGLLFGALASRIGVIAAALFSAFVFGAAHGDLVLFPSLAAVGFISAIAYAVTGNLWVSVTIHAVNNAASTTFLIAASLLGVS